MREQEGDDHWRSSGYAIYQQESILRSGAFFEKLADEWRTPLFRSHTEEDRLEKKGAHGHDKDENRLAGRDSGGGCRSTYPGASGHLGVGVCRVDVSKVGKAEAASKAHILIPVYGLGRFE